MFGLFGKKMAPEGPVDFSLDMDIERPAEEVYRLLDWADGMNAKRGEGHQVLAGDGPGRWRLIMTGMEDVTYHLAVREEAPARLYSYDCRPEPMVGRLISSTETYRIEPLPDGRCRVGLVVVAQFVAGMTESQFRQELAMMTTACHNALARLKIHAEFGGQAARDAEMIEANGYRIDI